MTHLQKDYIEPYIALKESFNNLADRHQSTTVAPMSYQQPDVPHFVFDSMTFMERMFMVRLDLRTLAAPILGYR